MEFKGIKGKWVLRENKSTIMSEEKCLIARVFDGKGTALLADKNQSDTIVEANALLISKAPEMLDMLIKARTELSRIKNSMMAHPDCTIGSEFDDYTSSAEECEIEIEQLIKEATEL